MKTKFFAVFILVVVLSGCASSIDWMQAARQAETSPQGNEGSGGGEADSPGSVTPVVEPQSAPTPEMALIKGRIVVPDNNL